MTLSPWAWASAICGPTRGRGDGGRGGSRGPPRAAQRVPRAVCTWTPSAQHRKRPGRPVLCGPVHGVGAGGRSVPAWLLPPATPAETERSRRTATVFGFSPSRAQGQAGVQRRLRSTPHKARGRRWVSSRWRDSRQRGQFPAPCGLQIQRVSCETCLKSQRERSIPRSPLRLEFSFSKEHAFRQEIVRTVGTSS